MTVIAEEWITTKLRKSNAAKKSLLQWLHQKQFQVAYNHKNLIKHERIIFNEKKGEPVK
ncbi:hypothetical protein ISS05_04645 [Candidatus Woesearchaeota archaeon]|nr:hypothetical protein [Candidatus Woesearchaeota archaeon]